jgi:choline dehydrogenase-like flavoprotein
VSQDFDVCVVGSGAGGGPVAFSLASAGYRVLVLEKGPWWKESDVTKDEVGECRRPSWTPRRHEEPHVVERAGPGGARVAWTTDGSPWNLWNGVAVGGATNLMSGFFLRLRPDDFRLRSAYGPVEGADVVDWPISYDDLEPWYARVEEEVGVSGAVVDHPAKDRRSTPDFPLPPTAEHPFAERLDATARRMGLHPAPLPRAVLPRPWRGRGGCDYSGHCASYACATGAKGGSRAAFVDRAVATGRCEVRPRATATRLESDRTGAVVAVHYRDAEGATRRATARVYVVACQAVETARLLLLSTGPRHPSGLGNGSGMVGRCLLFSPAGLGWGDFPLAGLDEDAARRLRDPGPFVNRVLHDWGEWKDAGSGRRRKGGTVDFLVFHPNPIAGAMAVATTGPESSERPSWGWDLKRRLRRHFVETAHLKFETFCDWMPMREGRVVLDPAVRDRFGVPVARVRLEDHPWHHDVTRMLCDRAGALLREMGAEDVHVLCDGGPSTNLQAGGCRFGRDPATSVLDPDCRAHEVENLYVTDGSFLPTGGSVPYTFTIYANALRVADRIAARLGAPR